MGVALVVHVLESFNQLSEVIPGISFGELPIGLNPFVELAVLRKFKHEVRDVFLYALPIYGEDPFLAMGSKP